MKLPRRQLVLAAALGGAALVAIVIVTRGGSTSAATAPAAGARTTAASQAVAPMPPADVRLELLNRTRAALGEPDRNPFRFRPRQAPPAPRAAAAPTAAVAAPPRPATPPAPAGPPPIPLRFIGLVEAPGQAGRVAILSDGRGNVFQGREGDILEGRYRIGRVNPDSLELSYADGRGRQVIRLSGQ